MAKKIGFIGLGNLGTPIAINLASDNPGLFVYNRTLSKTIPLADIGAEVCDSIESLSAKCDIIFTIVSDDSALMTVANRGLIQNLKPGGIHVSMSTILPATAAKLFELHKKSSQHYLAAPVFGRPEAAVAKKLNFAISGEQDVRKEIEPLLNQCGANAVWDFGEQITNANTVKLCGNFLIASALEAIGESTALAEKSGIDAHTMWNMFSQTLFSSPVYQNYSKLVLNKKFDNAGFTVKLGLKDVELILEQGKQVGQHLPLADVLQKNMKSLIKIGKSDIDWSAVSMGSTIE